MIRPQISEEQRPPQKRVASIFYEGRDCIVMLDDGSQLIGIDLADARAEANNISTFSLHGFILPQEVARG